MTAFSPTIDPLPVALFWITVAAWVIFWVTMAVRKNTAAPSEGRDGRLLIVASLWLGVLAAFAIAWAIPATRIAANGWLPLLVGIACVWAGIGLRLWAIQTLGRFFRTVVVIQDNHRLIDDGPYRFIRHPSYAGTVLSVFGVGLALDNWLSIIVGLIGALIGFTQRIGAEETALQKTFGPMYDAYAKHTWRLVPFIW